MSWLHARNESLSAACEGRVYAIGQALQYYQAVHGKYPPTNASEDIAAKNVSWRVLILPAWNRADFLDQYRVNEAWDSPHNARFVDHPYGESFGCAARSQRGRASFLAVVGEGSLWSKLSSEGGELGGEQRHKIVVVEIPDSDIVWTEPRDLSIAETITLFERLRRAKHRKGLHYLTADGRVHSMTEIETAADFAKALQVDD